MSVRPELPWVGDEATLLLGWLAFYRETLAIKCAGLSDEELKSANRPQAPIDHRGCGSETSLG
jgi:hypothetical protein